MRRRKETNDSHRINFLAGFYILISLVFIFRLFTIQVLDHSKYQTMAQEQYWNLQDLPARRGNIMSRDGYILATTQVHYLMYMEPKNIENKDQLIRELSTVLTSFKEFEGEEEGDGDGQKIDMYAVLKQYEEKIERLAGSSLYWLVVERNLTPVQKDEIEKLGLKGIGFEEEPVRYYPEKTLASHVLGFVGSDEKGSKKGYFGIEGRLDADLRGKPGRIVEEKDALGNPILVGGYKKASPINGRDIVLTIDRSVQYIVERRLKEGVEKYDSVSGTVIVMDPFTSEVIALANFPTYDPVFFGDESKESTQSSYRMSVNSRNLSISETYEPGSVIKPLTVAAAIDLKKVNPHTTYVDNGPVNYSGHWIDNWDGKHHGTLNIIELLQKSNNIGAAWVGHLVGSKETYKYFSDFGIGTKQGIDLEGEDSGILRDYKTWTDIDLANISFGQGMSATPLQVLNAFNVFANGGELHQPKIILKIVDEEKTLDIPTKKVRRVISKNTADTMNDLLTQAASGGEAQYFVLKNYKVAGKTGTAQIPIDGRYDPKKTNATFVGYLPTTRKFSMLVRIDRPTTSSYAAETAVPLWMDIAEDLIKYYGIPPDIQ